MDTKAAFDREAFEAWFEKEGHEELCGSSNVGAMIKHIAKSSWQASRAAIEIELPEEKPYKHNSYPEARAQDDGFNDALSECSTIITSHGIRIKDK